MYGYAGYGSPYVGYRTRSPINYRDTKPVASLAEYERYGQSLNHPVARKSFDAAKWRRAVIIMRGGECFKVAARLAGLKCQKPCYDKLPEHLR